MAVEELRQRSYQKQLPMSYDLFGTVSLNLGKDFIRNDMHRTFQDQRHFFSESMMHIFHCPKNVPKTIIKKRFLIVLKK